MGGPLFLAFCKIAKIDCTKVKKFPVERERLDATFPGLLGKGSGRAYSRPRSVISAAAH
jgi:hypothetical protein